MKKLFTWAVFLCFICGSTYVSAQVRYFDEVFSDVDITQDEPYGENTTVITVTDPNIARPVKQTLVMDIYEPMGDTVSERPVVLVACTGNFLPRILNGGPNGSIRDSANVELCTRLAKMGYVAVSFFYRQGWNPLSDIAEVRRSTLLQAAYRGVQDARTCVRYFKKSYAEDGNPFGIDTTRMAVGGIGTGGYVSTGASFLSEYAEILNAGNGKFIDFSNPTQPVPYVVEAIHGDIYGTSYGIVPPGLPFEGDTLSFPNHETYSSDFQVGFNLGGACGDSSWIDPGEVPFISFHVPSDPFAPYEIGAVIVPTTGEVVIDGAAGSYTITQLSNQFGNNQAFVDANLTDVYTMAANETNDGNEGLFPFDIPPPAPGEQFMCSGLMWDRTPAGDPWQWYDEALFIATWDAAVQDPTQPGAAVNCLNKSGNPTQSAESARTYMDTVMGYLAPRMVIAMSNYPTNLDDEILSRNLSIYPNPAHHSFTVGINNSANYLESVELLDMTGKLVQRRSGLHRQEVRFSRIDLPAGLYLVRVQAEKGVTTRKIMIK